MNNIFENAKFGDKFVCRNGCIVIFICVHPVYENFYGFIDEESQMQYNCPNGVFSYNFECYEKSNGSSFDIIGKWQEPINEEELDRLALEHSEPIDKIPDDWFNTRRVKLLVRSAYEAGYHKAKNQ